jgi:hypothetical protein
MKPVTQLLDDADRRIAMLEARLARLEAGVTSSALGASAQESVNESGVLKSVSSRRGLFKLAGAVATGAVASTMLSAQPAAAADGSNLVLGNASNTSTATTLLTQTTSSAVPALKVVSSSSVALGDAIMGVSGSSASAAGVVGTSSAGFGVTGVSTTGYDLYGSGNGRIGMKAHTVSGAPTSGSYDKGDIIRDDSGNMFVCVAAGSPGSWRKLAGSGTAGQLHLLPTSTRIYDTRPGAASQSGPTFFSNGTVRTIDLSGLVPVGSSAALVSVGVFSPSTDGYLSLSAAGVVSFGINVYWRLAGTSIANSTVTPLSSIRRFDVKATLSGGTTEAFVDVLGYYA